VEEGQPLAELLCLMVLFDAKPLTRMYTSQATLQQVIDFIGAQES
jgi:hypothetical protein